MNLSCFFRGLNIDRDPDGTARGIQAILASRRAAPREPTKHEREVAVTMSRLDARARACRCG
jgi:hypothetical protein